MRRTTLCLLLAGGVLAGCAIGPSLKEFTPAHVPGGMRVSISFGNRSLGGELLAVQDTSLLIATRVPERPGSGESMPLVSVPWRAIQRLYEPLGGGINRDRLDRERLRRMSRYPDGVSPELERQLLAAYRVDAIVWVSQ